MLHEHLTLEGFLVQLTRYYGCDCHFIWGLESCALIAFLSTVCFLRRNEPLRSDYNNLKEIDGERNGCIERGYALPYQSAH